MAKKLRVNYREDWDCEGYHTTQNVTITKEDLDGFNACLEKARNEVLERRKTKGIIDNYDMNVLMYGKNVENLNKCLTQTQFHKLCGYLLHSGYDTTRLLCCRNTMLKVKEA